MKGLQAADILAKTAASDMVMGRNSIVRSKGRCQMNRMIA